MLKAGVQMILLVLITVSVSCDCQGRASVIKAEVWPEIQGKEWSNFEVWAGEGLYFYERNQKAYCSYKIYGSGLPIIYEYTSEVTLNNDGDMLIQIPAQLEEGMTAEVINESQLIDRVLGLEGDTVLFNGRKFQVIFEKPQ